MLRSAGAAAPSSGAGAMMMMLAGVVVLCARGSALSPVASPPLGSALSPGGPVDRPPLIIGIAGGTASGKSALTAKVVAQLATDKSVSITQDSFYRDLATDELARVDEYNFDVPAAFDFDQCERVLAALKRGEAGVRIPDYDFVANARRPRRDDHVLRGVPRIVIFEGILALYDERLRRHMDIKVFVDADSDVRLARRIKRDIAVRGRSMESVLHQYERFVKPAFDEFVLPTKQFADVVVPRGAENRVAIDLLVQGIRARTLERELT